MIVNGLRAGAWALLLGCTHPAALAGGSNYGIAAGALEQVRGRIAEWPVPTPRFARDPAPGPDGAIYITVMQGDRIARFDPRTESFREWQLPAGAHPHGLVVDRQGIVWYTGNGNGTIGRLDPADGQVTEFAVPGGGDPHTIVLADSGLLWFTVQNGQRIGRLDPKSGEIREYRTSGNPYGIAVDRRGRVWFCKLSGDGLGWIDPATEAMGELATGPGSAPRRIALAPDGHLWVTYYGKGRIARIDPVAVRVDATFDLPPEGGRGTYAITVDAAGRIWANGIDTDTVSLFDPHTEAFRVIRLPSARVGIRKAIIDANGRYWYMGSHNGRLGSID